MKKTLISFSIFILLITLYRCRDFIYYTRMWLTYEPKSFMGNMEPPFPNWFEVMWSLKGPDRNKNGIRDDVEIYINNEFKDLNESELIMIYNAAVLVQSSLRYRASEDFLEEYWAESNMITECLGKYSSSTGKFDKKFKELNTIEQAIENRTRNTLLRSNVSRLFLNKFHMWSYESGGLRGFHMQLNMWKYCGLDRKESDKIGIRILKKKFSMGRKSNHLSNLKQYEDKYGKGNRNLYEKYFTRKDINYLDK
ncbi:hypothetical protein BIY24_12750 [Halobacteriovorax marinus]|uniref:hypothetical protein n=1 Tax=Halobacteriovorax marinus TaxID=97084 RepID=UPI000BC350CF|nr:hypothetical protein [Halobacteriovorax marinus]ATH08785.1 hypothetical protein BIY24_12750 [Halobacteriovorax marinus]